MSSAMLYGSLSRFKLIHCVDFAENALFSSFGVIWSQSLPSTLPDGFSVDKMNSNGLFSRYKMCNFNDTSYKTTADKLSSAKYLLSFLTFTVSSCAHSIYSCIILYIGYPKIIPWVLSSSFKSAPVPESRCPRVKEEDTEGILDDHPLSMLGRTLHSALIVL